MNRAKQFKNDAINVLTSYYKHLKFGEWEQAQIVKRANNDLFTNSNYQWLHDEAKRDVANSN